MPYFKDFYKQYLKSTAENYQQEVIKDLEGKHDISEIIGILIGHNSNYLVDALNDYTNWLFQNFEIRPKQ